MGFLSGLGGAVGAVAGGIGSSLVENNMNRQNTEYANRLNWENWVKMAEYNKPANQVNRLKEAGLNPALAYGSGSVANTVGAVPSVSAPRSTFEAGDPVGKYWQVRNQSLQTQQMKSIVRQAKAEADKSESAAVKERAAARMATYEADQYIGSGMTPRDNWFTLPTRGLLNFIRSLGTRDPLEYYAPINHGDLWLEQVKSKRR